MKNDHPHIINHHHNWCSCSSNNRTRERLECYLTISISLRYKKLKENVSKPSEATFISLYFSANNQLAEQLKNLNIMVIIFQKDGSKDD